MASTDNPTDLVVGDRIEITQIDGTLGDFIVDEINPVGYTGGAVRCKPVIGPSKFAEYILSYHYAPSFGTTWRRVAVTLPTIKAAQPVGATCRRCRNHNEYAEGGPEFVCRSCGMDGYGRTWGFYKERE